ncbi:MAG: helix-turn-helix domain-containing protein [Acidobacteriota bacterium]
MTGFANLASMGTTKKFSDYVQIKEAAEILGVSPSTIRNWARAGKLPEHRHPVNEYRLFDRADLQDLLDRVRQPHAPDASRRPSQERSA